MIPWFPDTERAIAEVKRTIAERRKEQHKNKAGAISQLMDMEAALRALQFMADLTHVEGIQAYVESNGTPVSEEFAKELEASKPQAQPAPPPRRIPAF